ncbi:hypothetical protein LLEC1_00996 [Akanthomyces lecanii]|uniref:Uncharacterized protein n=1 Tax=Cordyceps confragosa TaxID=2714763 RepID=A0A179IDM1_CORDF|nr:hypothetical protein LLEC1_00996 [Akanthomyces lecanii]
MSTPTRSTPINGAPASVTDSPGTWRHPRLNEITRRREATTFSEKNVRRIAYNIIALLCFWTIQLLVKMYIGPTSVSPSIRLYLSWGWTVVQLMPLVQVALACMPLLRARDEMTDIALTDAQRKLLGLAPAPPASSPAKDLTFSTPPRRQQPQVLVGKPVLGEHVDESAGGPDFAEPGRQADERGTEQQVAVRKGTPVIRQRMGALT